MNFNKMMKQGQEGFTLVELIVVIAILGILGGVAVPAYSGYVEKAEKAADDALLAEVNMAFAAACAVEGEQHMERNDTSATITDGKPGLQSKQAIVEAFGKFYEDGEEKTFKVYEWLDYQHNTGTFTGGLIDKAYKNLLNIFNANDLEKLKNSPYYQMGLGVLMDMVGEVGDVAADLWGNNANADAMMDDVYTELTAHGYTAEEQNNIIAAKLEQMIRENPQYAGVTVEDVIGDKATGDYDELLEMAENQILSNLAVLKVAQQSGAAADKMQAVLDNSNGTTVKENLITNIKNGDDSAIAQVAMSYGLYVAYAERNGLTVSNDYNEVLAGMESDGFQDYVKNSGSGAAADLQAFQSSMNMVNDASQDKDALSNILVNGFDDPSLAAILNQAIANAGK